MKSNVLEVPTPEVNEDVQPTTDKKYLKQAEKIVRRLDNVLNELNKVYNDACDLNNSIVSTEVSEKDQARFEELTSVVYASENILYQLTNRMARKYVGKEIDSLDNPKRKSLKV